MVKNYLLLPIICLFLLACSPVNLPTIQKYHFVDVLTKQPIHKAGGHSLLVEMLRSSEPYNTSKMYYERKPYLLESYALNAWVAAPGELLQPLVGSSLQNSGYFKAVVLAPFSGKTQFRLKLQLLQLKQSFLVKPSEVQLALKADLIRERTGQIIASRHFYQSRKTLEDTPYGGVVSINHALTKTLSKLTAFVVTACKPYQ